MLTNIKKYIKKFISPQTANLINRNATKNINIDICKQQKRILICYIDDIFHNKFYEEPQHTNRLEASIIVKAFIDLNYIIDVVWPLSSDTSIYKIKYDVIFGFGETYLGACKANPNAIKICYLTENNPLTVKEKFEERVIYYKERRGHEKKGVTRNNFYKQEYFECSDFGIILSNDYNSRRSYPYFKQSYLLNPSGLVNPNFVYFKKDFGTSKKHFVWFGSPGAIHKGLDILVDVFKNLPELYLHIYGVAQEEIGLLEIGNVKNIIIHPFISIYTSRFLEEVANQCAFAVLPSCSEGQSTSVITCMLHGLIPIVTREAGINIDDAAIFILEDYKVEYIIDQLDMIINLDDSVLEMKRKQIYDYANKTFTLEKFQQSFISSINSILDE